MKVPNSDSTRSRAGGRRDATLERLVDAAQETFAERGYRAANIHEICARADVGIGTFYTHFDDKRELLQHVFVDRAVSFSSLLRPADVLDHHRLVACLRSAVDEPAVIGLFRAWYEAVLGEPDIARFHAEWRASTLKDVAATIAEARERSPSDGPRLDPAIVSWTIATLAREMGIHDRKGAPDLDALARLFEGLVFGGVIAD